MTITISLKLSEDPKKKVADISSTLKDNIEKSLAEYKAGNYQTTHSVNELFKELNKN
ncbi:damage-inducible protein J [Lactobacillus amylovorus]|nr:damage-inducible protein J [Lactobacillus amylovorus]